MTTGHLDATRLAEHVEGLLAPEEAAAVEAHLRECDTCQATAADLVSVSAMLADAPATLPVPEHVAARLDRALDEEAAPEPEPAPVVELSWFRRRAPQLLAAAATVGVLGFAGWVVASGGAGGDDSEEGAATVAESGGRDAADESAADDTNADEDAEESELHATEEDAEAPPLAAEEGQAAIAAPELADEIRAVFERAQAESAERATDTCGLPLAEDLGLELVGTAATEARGEIAVLVVVQSDDPDLVHGWVVPGCDATADEALTELTVEVD